jgi:AcrR family transcriptional regulator
LSTEIESAVHRSEHPEAEGAPPSDRVRQIIAATVAVMGRQGYAATSMKDIAQEAGIAQGLIHYYFSSKEELLGAVVQSLCDEMLADMRRDLAEASGDPLERAWNLLGKVRDRCAARTEFSRLLFEMVTLSFGNENLARHLRRLYAELTAATTGMVAELDASLPTRMPVPGEDVAVVITAAIDGLILRSLIDPERDQDALYRALGFLLISSMLLSYALAEQPMPAQALLQIVGDRPADELPPPLRVLAAPPAEARS